ncbi:BQ2448_4825 [Microbotryum intermedium]|uniref:BQ2448_4825 protein n=1 Tax=Microbotryum intermedium TaxID=269621 RepID=A0A238FJ00_9BASI|nr:BQ2448_4825 [Microbotryum intermedium]
MRTSSIVFALGTLIASTLTQFAMALPQASTTGVTQEITCNSCVFACNQKHQPETEKDVTAGVALTKCMDDCVHVYECKS